MAAVTLAQIMAGIQTRLNTIDGLNTSDIVPGGITPPFAIVGVPDVPSYREAFGRGSWRPNPTITVYTSQGHTQTGQLLLAEYADVTGAKSIPRAVEGDRTLGGLAVDCTVKSFQTLGEETVSQIGYYGGVFELLLIASGI
jgi:hypothetical protein